MLADGQAAYEHTLSLMAHMTAGVDVIVLDPRLTHDESRGVGDRISYQVEIVEPHNDGVVSKLPLGMETERCLPSPSFRLPLQRELRLSISLDPELDPTPSSHEA